MLGCNCYILGCMIVYFLVGYCQLSVDEFIELSEIVVGIDVRGIVNFGFRYGEDGVGSSYFDVCRERKIVVVIYYIMISKLVEFVMIMYQ